MIKNAKSTVVIFFVCTIFGVPWEVKWKCVIREKKGTVMAMDGTCICTMCGKKFDFWDTQENFCFDHHIGYGSKYDMQRVQIKLCCDCFDKVMDWVIPQCKHNPMSEYELGQIVYKEI